MKIEDLIAQIKTDKTNGKGKMPPGIMEAITGLVSRLEGMLPNIETARSVATQLKVEWTAQPNDAVLAWAWTVWPLYDAGRIGDLESVVVPLLPEGQPYGQSEIDTVRGETLLAEVEGDKKRLKKARAKGRAMLAHNLGA